MRTSISVGVAHHQGTTTPASTATHRLGSPTDTVPADMAAIAAAGEREATAAVLLRLADTAMYAAKSAGKGRAAVLEEDPVLALHFKAVST